MSRDPEAPPPDGGNYYRWGTEDSSVIDDTTAPVRRALILSLLIGIRLGSIRRFGSTRSLTELGTIGAFIAFSLPIFIVGIGPRSSLPCISSGGPVKLFFVTGVDRLYITAIQTIDYPVVMAIVMVIGIGIVIMNIVADILYGVLDPRVRRYLQNVIPILAMGGAALGTFLLIRYVKTQWRGAYILGMWTLAIFIAIRNMTIRFNWGISFQGAGDRASMLEVLHSDYLRTAKAKGLPPAR
ncbi:hypothetical protein AAFF_G00069720 [Aldrovandia affinis]|uniref:ABC transmembrane type-1 domain-containing protein n=1 Tax=Aldrovandia affinis TaxID=143900 RepID=A0AAD7VXP9_9TELE|nr:hypothetical protein AAFF_G00069720 [Aldrovandia affinis]